ncbi:MAG: 16S rRNA (cytidine(1402)-2'-O)-methyltransferase [Gracilibacteraceae bacterium]|jgi:16S rRNA (cytidine1402-2'-O)-methyltransferase|nr:16S rRNA (cytidine(1402)-2'-O)-methyltransferase [Gracilibacteraceae bacterium]
MTASEAGGGADKPGVLYVCATPIGNLEDVTLRVLRILKEADMIAAEDTRRSRKLLAHYGIKTPLISCHEHNERRRAGELLRRLRSGQNVALVSDAGLPGISDPGAAVIRAAREARIEVDVLPGPSAGVTALVLSGLPAEQFLFLGFPPAARGARQKALQALESAPYTLVFYEAPHRLAATLGDMAARWPERRAAVARELTKLHQDLRAGTVRELAEHFTACPPKGECCLLVAPADPPPAAPVPAEAVLARLEELAAAGLGAREARAAAAEEYGMSKNEIYRLCLEGKGTRRVES